MLAALLEVKVPGKVFTLNAEAAFPKQNSPVVWHKPISPAQRAWLLRELCESGAAKRSLTLQPDAFYLIVL